MFNFSAFTLFLLVCVSADNWAVLICGSAHYWNYRHHADVSHAYQILRAGGLDPDHIITFMYNDVPFDDQNPFSGKLYNHPGDQIPNVYEGVTIDYSKDQVNAETILKVLIGDSSAGGKVLESTAIDNIIIYIANNGGMNILSLPADLLYSDELINAFRVMHENQMYNKMVVYAEGSYSGSLFLDLPSDLHIYAVTAANEDDVTKAWFCEQESTVQTKQLGVCLGDEFSIKLLEELDKSIRSTVSLEDQFHSLEHQVSNSRVSRYGDFSFVSDSIGSFWGYPTESLQGVESVFSFHQMDTRDVKLNYLRSQYELAEEENITWKGLVDDELQTRKTVEKYMLGITKTRKYYMTGYGVKDFGCYRRAINRFVEEVGLSEYALVYFRVFANLCNENENAF